MDVQAIARLQPDYNGLRVAQYLHARRLLIPDPAAVTNSADSADTAINRALARLPEQFRTETTAWITMLRGHSRRRHRALLPTTIRRYVDHILPVLLDWSQTFGSLREITSTHVHDALAATSGYARAQLQVTLRSLFRALKQERLIFHDPPEAWPCPTHAGCPSPCPATGSAA